MKRTIDILFSTLAMIVLSPVFLIVTLVILVCDGRPVFFVQKRAGLNGRPFRMYKFRSMVVDAEKRLKDLIDIDNLDEPVFKIKNDPRVTWIGRFLRRTSMDELPQLYNVLKGEMSLIGPRPEESVIVEKYNSYQRKRLSVKPGITGLQQIMNRGEASLSRRVKYDLLYIKKRNAFMETYILFKTVSVVLMGKGTTT